MGEGNVREQDTSGTLWRVILDLFIGLSIVVFVVGLVFTLFDLFDRSRDLPSAVTTAGQPTATAVATQAVGPVPTLTHTPTFTPEATATSTPTPPPTLPPTATPAAPAVSTPAIYVVKTGDTLFSIARRTGFDVTTLQVYNHIAYPNYLQVGQRLRIPPLQPVGGGGANPAPPPTQPPALTPPPAPAVTPVPTAISLSACTPEPCVCPPAEVILVTAADASAPPASDLALGLLGRLVGNTRYQALFAGALGTLLFTVLRSQHDARQASQEIREAALAKAKLEVALLENDRADRRLGREMRKIELDKARLEVSELEQRLGPNA